MSMKNSYFQHLGKLMKKLNGLFFKRLATHHEIRKFSNLMNVIFMFIVIVMTDNNRLVIAAPKSIQATVTLLENLHIILEKTPPSDIRAEILPLLFNSFESNTMQIQSAALLAVANVYEYVDEVSIRRMVLPKIKTVFEKNQSDLKIMANVLQCIERVLDKLEKSQIIDEVLPMLYEIRLSDPEIILRIVRKLASFLCYRK